MKAEDEVRSSSVIVCSKERRALRVALQTLFVMRQSLSAVRTLQEYTACSQLFVL